MSTHKHAVSFSMIQGGLGRDAPEPGSGVRHRSDVLAAAQRMIDDHKHPLGPEFARAIRDGLAVHTLHDACGADAHDYCGGGTYDGRFRVCSCSCHRFGH